MSNVADLRLNGLNPLSYQGVNPYTPVPFFTSSRPNAHAPTVNDYQNFTLGTIWLDQVTQTAYMLVNINRVNAVTIQANWVPFVTSYGIVAGLQGNTGGFVGPTGAPPYINVVGDGTGITISGNPSTHTLTASLVGGGVAAQTFLGNTGTATPTALGVLSIVGDGTHTRTTASGNTITITLVGTGIVETLTGDSGGAISPTAGNINIISGFSTLNSGSTVKIAGSGSTLTLDVTDSNTNTIIGNGSGISTLSGASNTIIGSGNFLSATSGYNNVVVGSGSLTACTTGYGNTIFGNGIMTASTSAAGNTIIGDGAGENITIGIDNCLLGGDSGISLTSGGLNCLIGIDAGTDITTGSYNIGIGQFVFVLPTTSGLTTGSYNIAIGAGNSPSGPHSAGDAYTSSESSNILIGNRGVNGESNTIHIGTTGTGNAQQSTCFIAGSYGVTTTSGTTAALLISNTGQLGTVSSSRRYKDNIKDMGAYSSKVLAMRPVTFNYKQHPGITSMGLIAEEVAEIMPELVNLNDEGLPESVKYHDFPALLLNEIIKLRVELDELKRHLN